MEGSGSIYAAERGADHKAHGWAGTLDKVRGNGYEAPLLFLASILSVPLWN